MEIIATKKNGKPKDLKAEGNMATFAGRRFAQ
jgi:hypothetical protein